MQNAQTMSIYFFNFDLLKGIAVFRMHGEVKQQLDKSVEEMNKELRIDLI